MSEVEDQVDAEGEVPFTPDDYVNAEPSKLIAAIVRRAIELEASDLFLLAEETSYTISVKRLGSQEKVMSLSKEVGASIVNRVKAEAGMDLSEKIRPVDGRWRFSDDEFHVDFRVNSLGTLYGEDLAMRVLIRESHMRSLEELGMEKQQLGQVRAMLQNMGGLVLVTGPTGSGKTTTLYACLSYLNDGTRKINTLEDPIEHSMDGVRQTQVLPKRGIDFVELLRGAMRQAPDVIMVGEIRDSETAKTAVRAANSGHLVLATVHAPVSTSAVQSILAYGIHPLFLASCLQGVVAQRLIRELNPATKVSYEIGHASETFADIKNLLSPGEGNVIYGPDQNDQSRGYNKMTGLFEILEMTDELKELVAEGVSSGEFRAGAIQGGLLDFRRSALLKVARGITSIEEIGNKVPNQFLDS